MTKQEKMTAHELRHNLLSANIAAVSKIWRDYRKMFTVEEMEILTEVCGD